MPVLGADPDAPEKEWEETPRIRVKGSKFDPKTIFLVNYFAYHKAMMDMTRKCPQSDKEILRYTFARLLKQGYSEQSLKFVVDRFFQSWAADAERPAMLFATRKVLSQLLTEADVSSNDPMLQWMLEGMPNVGPVEDPKAYRKALMLNCDQAIRYPDVIADIFRLGFGYETTCLLLQSLETVVRYNLAGKPYNRRDVDPHLDRLAAVNLPRELRSHVPSPQSVRQRFDKMSMAVAASVPTQRKEVEW